jgi:hypothetical protein
MDGLLGTSFMPVVVMGGGALPEVEALEGGGGMLIGARDRSSLTVGVGDGSVVE